MQLNIFIFMIEISLFAISSCGENRPQPVEKQISPSSQQMSSPAPQENKATPKTDEVMDVDVFPAVLKQVQPKYPEEASKKGIQGDVMLKVRVNEKGMPVDVTVSKNETGSPELGEAAVTAVKQWTFKPAMKKGTPVSIWVAIPVRFKLK